MQVCAGSWLKWNAPAGGDRPEIRLGNIGGQNQAMVDLGTEQDLWRKYRNSSEFSPQMVVSTPVCNQAHS